MVAGALNFTPKLPLHGLQSDVHAEKNSPLHHDHADTIAIPSAYLLFSGDYSRSGADLILSKDGHELVVPDYFRGEKRASLASPDGARLSGDLVNSLTGHVQYAQAAGVTADIGKVIGHVTKLTGSATAVRNGVSITLNMGDNCNKGDVVQCGSDGTLGITFIDGTVFGLSSNARMVLNEMVYDPNGSSNSSLLSLVQGTITFVAGETAKNGDMKVDTPVATVGIRGTAVLIEIGFEVPCPTDPSVPISCVAPPVKFSVLREPDGHIGSYVLFSKTTGAEIGTVNQAGQVTSVSSTGNVSTATAQDLSPAAKAIVEQTLQAFFPNYTPPADNKPNANPQSNPSGGGSSTPPPDAKPGDTSPIKDVPIGTPTIVPIPINLPAPTLDNTTATKTVSAQVTTTLASTPTVLINTAGHATNQTTQTISGTVDVAYVGTTVTLFDNGSTTPLATAVVSNGGLWSASVTLSGDGPHSIVAMDTNTAGNSSASAPVLFTLDTTAPVVVIGNTGGLVNQANLTITGTVDVADAGATVTILDGATPIGSAIVQSDGSWSSNVTLNTGSNSLTAQVTDAAGNIGSTSSALIYTLNTTAPTGGTPALVAASDSGSSSIDNITDVTAPTFTVTLGATVVAGDTVQLLLGGAPLAHPVTHIITAADVTAGRVSLSVVAGDLGVDGTKLVSAQLSDSFGNSSTTAALSITLDTTAPAVAITTIEGGDNIINAAEAAGGIQISGTAEIGSSLTVNGAAVTVDGTGHWTTSVTPAGQGALVVTAVATDTAGNSASTSTTLTVDTTAPAVAITSPGGPVNQPAQTITGTGEAGTTVTLFDNGSTTALGTTIVQSDGSWSTGVTLTAGTNSLTATDTDAAGNIGSTSSALIYTLNTTAPTGGTPALVAASDSGSSSIDNITDVTAPTFTVTLGATVVAGDTVQLLLGGAPLAHPVTHIITAADVTAGRVSLSVVAGDLGVDGTKLVSAQLSDSFGNSSTTAALSITLDTTAPAVAITTIEGGDNIINAAEAAGGIQISGTAEIGSSLTVNGAAVTVDGTGHWTTSVTPAGQGALVVTAVATDTAGNSASTSTTLTVDTTAPAVAITSPGGPVNQPAQTITGTGEAGTTVTLFDNGSTTALGTTIVQSDGSWSTGVTLTAGTNSLTATDTDAAGNIGSTSSALIYTLNTTAPTGGTPALVAASDSGSSSIDNITDVTAPTFTVTLGATVVAGDTVQLLLGGAPLAHPVTHIITAADVTAGRVSLSVVAGDLGVDGTKLVSAQLSDSFGNSSTTAALSITLDTTAPAVAITTIEGGDNIINAAEAAGGIQISGTAEIGSSLTVNGAAVTVDGTGHWTTSVTPAGQGALVVTAVATDTAGNSASTSTTLTVDTTAPAVAITSPGGPVNQPAQTITGTGEAGTTVTLFDNGSTTALGTTIVQSDGSWSTGVTLTAGTNSLTATDTDAAGNIGSTSSALIYTLNTTAPTGGTPALVAASDSGSSSIDNITDVTAPTFTVTLGATVVAGDTVQLLLGGAPLAHPVTHIITAADVTAGRVSLSVVAGDLGVDGTKLVSAQLSDSFGNSSTTAALSITLDTTAPAVAITTIEGGDNIINAAEAAGGIQISGTAEIGSSLTVNGAAVTVDGTGHWTTSVTPAGQGALVVTAVATDTAGNSASTSTTLTVDTTAPAVAITSPGGPVNQPAQTITGTGEAGTTVTLFDNGSTTALGTTIVQSDGSWSTGVTLTAGTNSLTATDTDAAGNIGSTSSALIYTLNTTAPTGGTPALVAASDSGSSSIDNITDVTAPTFTVTLGATVVAGDTVQLLLGGAPLAHPVTHIITAADVTAGRVSLSVVAGDLGVDGTKLVSAQLSDSFGNSSTTAALSITLDTTAPAVAITTIEGGDNIINAAEAAGGIQISGTAEIGSSLTVNGAAVTVDGTGHWTTSVTPAGQGALVVTAVATDTAGNSASTSTTLTVDTTAPAVAITSPGGPVNQPAQTITGTGEAGTTVTLFDNGSTTALGTTIVQSDGSWSTGVTLTAGTNSLTATDTDAAGNIGSTSSALIYTLNTTAPTGGTPALVAASDSGSSSIDNITDVTAPTFTVTLGATVVAGDTVQLLLGGAPLAHPVTHIITAADVTAGRVSLSVVAGDLGVDGTKLVSAQLSDSFGNSSTTAALSITLDTTAPAVAITTIEGGDNIINAAEAAGGIQISGTAEIGSSLTVNGAAVTVDGTGHWTTSVTPAGQGALVVTAVATDTAGNSASTSTTLTVDTTAPAVAITTIEGGDNIINAAEAAGGIQISGTAEIGSSLTVNGAAVTVDGTVAPGTGPRR